MANNWQTLLSIALVIFGITGLMYAPLMGLAQVCGLLLIVDVLQAKK